MKIEILHKLLNEYTEQGLYNGSFECLSITSYRQIEYANNVILVESDEDTEDEVLVVYSLFEEATRCLYWSNDIVSRYINELSPSLYPIQDFLALYKTHFRGSRIFEHINTAQIESVFSFSHPAYDDWCGELFVKAAGKKFVLMWDYCD